MRLVRQSRHLPRVLSLHDYWYLCPNGQYLLPDHSLCMYGASPRRCAECALSRAGFDRGPALRSLAVAAMAWRNSYVHRAAMGLDIYVTPSDFACRVYIANGWDAARIRVVELGVDMARLAGTSVEPRAAHPFRIGYLGAIAWQKGVHVLIQAFNRLPADAQLTIYGDESTFPAYSRELHGMAGHAGVRFAGPLNPADVGGALSGLDYLVVPSLWYETFGMVVQEAEAVGTPVIASRIGALERIRDHVDGRLFSPGKVDELERVLREAYDHPELRATLSANLAAGKTQTEQALAWMGIYEELVARHRTGSGARVRR